MRPGSACISRAMVAIPQIIAVSKRLNDAIARFSNPHASRKYWTSRGDRRPVPFSQAFHSILKFLSSFSTQGILKAGVAYTSCLRWNSG